MSAVDMHRPSPLPLLDTASEHAARRLRDDRTLVRLRPRIFAEQKAWQRLQPWERYLARVHAAALALPGAVFSHESAAALRGLPLFGEPRDIHVFDASRTQSRRFGDVAVHTSQDDRHVVESAGVATVSPSETVIDLARVLPPAFALAVMDAAISHRADHGIALATLEEVAHRQANRRGTVRVEWALQHADARAESAGESVSRAVILWCGFEAPELQRTFHHEGVEDRADFYWPRLRAIGESDGFGKYAASTADESIRRVMAEKLREDRLRRHEDAFARWTWRETMHWPTLRSIVLRVGVPVVRTPQPSMLATLRRNPRSLG
ncbi:hypothetical protein M4I32_03030 [Microbacterium sp. LRZ72]|uniref:hypothetical protein n=1 Tax=Microbacterium sp. LRZ72 TaxID=2942481 RepID=UPI0029B84720|nr:hypothetical protein [Microbacterium sp. LRZ72]MDX2375769.1 hypothetical protein [Microbacterium sp. LRZ72]